jgi:MraZ protein
MLIGYWELRMFFGQFRLIIGDDRRMMVPEPYRILFADGAFVTRGFEKNLMIMSSKVFQERCQHLSALNIAEPAARLLLRMLLAHASRIDVDSSGHVQFPQDLMSFAGLDKEIILLGQGEYLEAWAPDDWKKQAEILMNIEANNGRFAQLDLAL